MTVDELIVKLAQYPGDMTVYVDSGHCEDTEPAVEVEDYKYWVNNNRGVRIW
jgi:hypothetical protein